MRRTKWTHTIVPERPGEGWGRREEGDWSKRQEAAFCFNLWYKPQIQNIPHTGIRAPQGHHGGGGPVCQPPPYWICHTPQTSSTQTNQNMDTLTQHDSEVVIHQNSKQKHRRSPRHCSVLMVLDAADTPRGPASRSQGGSSF